MNNRFTSSSRARGVLVVSAAFGLLASVVGCGLGGGATDPATTTHLAASAPAWGHVHGGQQPVTGATVTIYLAGVNTPGSTSGYGSGATALATTTTDNSGNFSFASGAYTCPNPTQQAYIVATGGNPGLTGVNSNITLLAALGPCPAGGNLIATVPYININEVTTVAAVWALQQFMAPPAAGNVGAPQIGAPNTTYSNGLSGANAASIQSAVQGMNNAFITAKILADVSTGQSPNATYNAYATPEISKINTLADILSYCVNSDPASSAHCQNLENGTTPAGQTVALDTAQAAWYMAQNTTNNLPTLYGYISGSGTPFQPYLGVPGGVSTGYFNDTTIAINYAPLGPNTVRGTANTNDFALANASDVAIDMYGNAWFINRGQFGSFTGTPNDNFSCVSAACNTQDVSELGVDGSVLVNQIAFYTPSTTGGAISSFTTPPAGGARTFGAFAGSLAIDLTNRAWVTDNIDSAASTYNAKVGTQVVLVGSVGVFPGSTAAGVNATGGNATLTNGTGYVVGAQPFGIAIDGSNNAFLSMNEATATNVFGGLSFAKMSATDGSGYTVATGTASGLPASGQAFLDIDTNPSVTGGLVWTANTTACTVTGQLYSGGTGNTTAYGLISQYAGGSVAALGDSEVATTISNATAGAGSTTNCGATTDYVGQVASTSMANPFALAVDRNNGVWISDQFKSSSGFDGLTYLSAATASSGSIPSSYYVYNGVLPSSSTASTPTAGKDGTTLQGPARLAVDGNNNVWVTNSYTAGSTGSIAEASINPSTGVISFLTPGQGGNPVISGTTTQFGNNSGATYGIGFLHNFATPTGIAIDSSGNVWVANQSNNGSIAYAAANGSKPYTGLSTTVIVGAAAPVITPKALAVKYSKIGSKP